MRVGVAGLRRGQSFLRVFGQRDDCEVVAVCDTSPEALAEVGDRWQIPTRLDLFDDLIQVDLDAVVIATPGPLHARQAIAALDAGRNVLSEVPAAWTLEECHDLVAAANRADGIYMFAENMCYFHYLQEWRDRIQRGDIGEITYVEAEYVHDIRPRMQEGNWRKDMPPIYYCTHSLGPVLDILDDRCVQAIGLSTGPRTSPEISVDDLEVGLFRTARGVVVKILCGFSVCREPAFHWQVFYGTEGVIENGRPPADPAKVFRQGQDGMQEIEAEVSDPGLESAVTGGHGTSEMLLVEDFVKAARGEQLVSIDVYRGVEMTAPGLCAHESALQDGAPVSIPDFR